MGPDEDTSKIYPGSVRRPASRHNNAGPGVCCCIAAMLRRSATLRVISACTSSNTCSVSSARGPSNARSCSSKSFAEESSGMGTGDAALEDTGEAVPDSVDVEESLAADCVPTRAEAARPGNGLACGKISQIIGTRRSVPTTRSLRLAMISRGSRSVGESDNIGRTSPSYWDEQRTRLGACGAPSARPRAVD